MHMWILCRIHPLPFCPSSLWLIPVFCFVFFLSMLTVSCLYSWSHVWGYPETASVIGYAGTNGCLFIFPPVYMCVYLHVSVYLGTVCLGVILVASPTMCTLSDAHGPLCLNVIACCLHDWRRDWGSDGEGRLYPGSERTDLHGNGLISVSGPSWHCPPHWWIGQCLHSFCLLLPGRWAQKQGKLSLLNSLNLHVPWLSDWRV